MKEIYRRCASVLLVRHTADQPEVLLVHKPRKKDAWQLPQGGCEAGESISDTAVREMKEETGLDIEVIQETDAVYQYDFPKSYRRFRPDNVKGQTVHFVIADITGNQAVEVDGEEIDDHKWVEPKQLKKYLKRKEYLKKVLSLVESTQ